MQEITYSGSGSETSQLDYYSIAGHLLGETNGSTTTYDLTDAQGTILISLTASAIQGEQADDPYGNIRYSSGTIGTDKGYTGQFDDSVTGLDYDNARWYDPVSGQFLSPDTVQGNAQGMDPYAYVGNDPETRVDPTGNRYIQPTPGNGVCPSGEEAEDGGCAQDPGSSSAGSGSAGKNKVTCNGGMSPDSVGDCVYNNGGCAGLTIDGCQQQQTEQKAKEEKAYRDAEAARDQFLSIANVLGSAAMWFLSILLTAVTAALGAFFGLVGGLVAGVLSGMVDGLEAIGLMAGQLANVFLNETNMVDLVKNQKTGYSWFTSAHLQDDSQQIDSDTDLDIAAATGAFVAIAGVYGTTGILAGALKNMTQEALGFIFGGLSTDVIATAVAAGGAIWLQHTAQSYLEQEETDVA